MRFFYFFLFSFISGCATVSSIDNTSHPQVQKIHKAMASYSKIQHQPWPHLNAKQTLKPGSTHNELAEVKKRLILLKDWPIECEQNSTHLYDNCLKNAVRHFQKRHGLKDDGVLGQSTIQQLNVSPSERITSLQQSLEMWKKLPPKMADTYLLVNIPSYELQAINQGKNELSMRVVVGSRSWQTPTLDSEIKTIEINPGWNVPVNITEKEIIHKVLEDPNYLEEHNLKILESWKPDAKEINPRDIDWQEYAGPKDMPYRLVQEHSETSALGKIKFIFPNKDHIYLHDTPLKSLFNQPQRNLSHGCIRLEQPLKLLEYLSQTNPKLKVENVKPYLATTKSKHLALNKNMPLHITYITSWVDNDEVVQFRDDIYGHFSQKRSF
ncbi:murein L,D-transpeptidase [Legionella sp. W05-934-2]|jgi:murein L,D-transpeptidase YcbB/YkuD|uniref:L,D-transpeptidase family protein n=1 Tax=Legionella sp. W05-934-2 TaxID=1198649 RepID=UPI003461C532